MKRNLSALSLSPEMLVSILAVECSDGFPADKAWLMKEYTEQMKEFSMPSWAVERYCVGSTKVCVKAFVSFGVVMILVDNCIVSFVIKSILSIIDMPIKRLTQDYYRKIGSSLIPTSGYYFCEALRGARRYGGVNL